MAERIDFEINSKVLEHILNLGIHQNWYSINIIGSRFYGYQDHNSDHDFLVLGQFNENVQVDDFFIEKRNIQLFKFDYEGWKSLLIYFSDGNNIDGDWGELGLEAYLHFIQFSATISGNKEKLNNLKNLLKYPDFYKKSNLKRQSCRIINSLRQKKHSYARSKTLDLKCRYDFVDAFLRLIYLANNDFYSTLKWFHKDLIKYSIPKLIIDSLNEILSFSNEKWENEGVIVIQYLYNKSIISIKQQEIEILTKESLW